MQVGCKCAVNMDKPSIQCSPNNPLAISFEGDLPLPSCSSSAKTYKKNNLVIVVLIGMFVIANTILIFVEDKRNPEKAVPSGS